MPIMLCEKHAKARGSGGMPSQENFETTCSQIDFTQLKQPIFTLSNRTMYM